MLLQLLMTIMGLSSKYSVQNVKIKKSNFAVTIATDLMHNVDKRNKSITNFRSPLKSRSTNRKLSIAYVHDANFFLYLKRKKGLGTKKVSDCFSDIFSNPFYCFTLWKSMYTSR